LPKTLPSMVNPQLAAAMSHPTRIHAMTLLLERAASPREIAAELDEPINNVTYHVDQLLKLGCIELVETRPVRGGRVVEHLYKANRRAYFDDEAWAQFEDKEKYDVTTAILRLASEDVSAAASSGTLYEPDDGHMSRTPLTLDPTGWIEANSLLDQTMEGMFAIQQKVLDREKELSGETERLHTKVHLFHFPSPSPKKR
jgi:DNA-binding transcriptional ArsR family regulator